MTATGFGMLATAAAVAASLLAALVGARTIRVAQHAGLGAQLAVGFACWSIWVFTLVGPFGLPMSSWSSGHGSAPWLAALAFLVALWLTRARALRVSADRRPLYIVMVADSLPPKVDGVTMCILRMVPALSRRNTLVVASGHPTMFDAAVSIRLPSLEAHQYPGHRIAFPVHPALWLAIAVADVVVLVDETPLSILTLPLAALSGARIVWTHHTHGESYPHIAPFLWRAGVWPACVRVLRALLAPLADAHPAVSPHLVAALSPHCNARLWPAGVDVALLPPETAAGRYAAAAAAAATRARWIARWQQQDTAQAAFHADVSDAPVRVLLCVARMGPEKNWDDVLLVARALRNTTRVRTLLVFAGDGPEAARIASAVVGLPVLFLGGITDRGVLAAAYGAADAFLLPSLSEAMPLVGLEAQAAGLPLYVQDESLRAQWLLEGAVVRPWSAIVADVWSGGVPAKYPPIMRTWAKAANVLECACLGDAEFAAATEHADE